MQDGKLTSVIKSSAPIPVKGGLFSSKEAIERLDTEELVIALCGPIGSPLHDVAKELKSQLEERFAYKTCEIIRLSDFIKKHGDLSTPAIKALRGTDDFIKKKSFIEAGNALREKYNTSVLANLAIHRIAKSRPTDNETRSRRVCHIIDSIKNQEELETLRRAYSDVLYFVGVFSPLETRCHFLTQQDRAGAGSGMAQGEFYSLVDQDSGEEKDTGQTVRDTFPAADYFLRIETGDPPETRRKVERFLDLILGTKIMTPTYQETAMYKAASASSNSACLSRQVGAAITDQHGELLSVGWNDVPKSGGNLYRFNAEAPEGADKRCWSKGYCSNDVEKHLVAKMLVDSLVSAGLVDSTKRQDAEHTIRKNKKVGGLIEFSRSIHAEMHAIISAGQTNGARLVHGKLFCTTYPCHSCARHIIAAGIAEIYYIEPYRKSLAVKLHEDAITENESDTKKVRLIMFDGAAPSRYLWLFKMAPDSRKDSEGRVQAVDPKAAKPRFESRKTLEAVTTLESLVVRELESQNLIPV